jgi:hypothetical protein
MTGLGIKGNSSAPWRAPIPANRCSTSSAPRSATSSTGPPARWACVRPPPGCSKPKSNPLSDRLHPAPAARGRNRAATPPPQPHPPRPRKPREAPGRSSRYLVHVVGVIMRKGLWWRVGRSVVGAFRVMWSSARRRHPCQFAGGSCSAPDGPSVGTVFPAQSRPVRVGSSPNGRGCQYASAVSLRHRSVRGCRGRRNRCANCARCDPNHEDLLQLPRRGQSQQHQPQRRMDSPRQHGPLGAAASRLDDQRRGRGRLPIRTIQVERREHGHDSHGSRTKYSD